MKPQTNKIFLYASLIDTKASTRAPRYPEANQGGHRLALRQEMVELQRISLQNIQPSSKLNVYRLSAVQRAKQALYITQRLLQGQRARIFPGLQVQTRNK